MHFDEALQYLSSLGHETLSVKLGLDSTKRLLDTLHQPQSQYPNIQLAGTNGKGSTAAMLAAMCRAAGIKSGLYTSPHLVSFTERIRIDGHEATPELFAHAVSVVRDAALGMQSAHNNLPTFFEQMTAAAFVAFRAARVQLGILETGLGGRLDSTTAARATTVAITPIALDHQEHLGNTLIEIAAEKAAIIHPGVTAAVIAPQTPEAEEVIKARCRECGIEPRFAARNVRVVGACDAGRLRVDFETIHDAYKSVRLSLRGRHQAINAAVAIELAESLRERGFAMSRKAIIEGLETAEHRGRLEMHPGTPTLLFDGAHNEAGARALRDYLDEFVRAPITLVFGAMRDKELTEIAATLFPAARSIVLTQPANPRAADFATLQRAAPSFLDSGKIIIAPTVAEALTIARQQTAPDGLVCVTGSLYLIGEALQKSDE